ncbi:MAG: hypothetical protein CMP23_03870 [Rickettsiales bacterium]|nr:hypothetical protein [Rickettsiales bacterium]
MSRNARLLPIACGFYLPIFCIALLWGWLRELWPQWWTLSNRAEILQASQAGILLGLLGVGLSWQLTRSVPAVRKLSDRIGMVLAGQSGRYAVALALLSSIAEEFLFRGCLQSELGLWPATILFALVHIGNERLWLWWTATAFVAGLAMGLLYEHSGGLLAPVLMHFVINAINIHILAGRGARARAEKGPAAALLDPS